MEVVCLLFTGILSVVVYTGVLQNIILPNVILMSDVLLIVAAPHSGPHLTFRTQLKRLKLFLVVFLSG